VRAYLLPTLHLASESALEAIALCEAVRPDVVFVELCAQRVGMLAPAAPATSEGGEELGTMKLRGVFKMWRADAAARGEDKPALASLAPLLFAWTQAKMAHELGVAPGDEFRAAAETGAANGAAVVLGDRPLADTLKAAWGSLGFFSKGRLMFHMLLSSVFSPSSKTILKWIEDCRARGEDFITAELRKMSRCFPTVVRALIQDRDRYMAEKLRLTCEMLQQSGGGGGAADDPRCVVAIVGAGHVPGIRALWENDAWNGESPEDMAALSPSSEPGVVVLEREFFAGRESSAAAPAPAQPPEVPPSPCGG